MTVENEDQGSQSDRPLLKDSKTYLVVTALLALAAPGLIFGMPYALSQYYTLKGDHLQSEGHFAEAAEAYEQAIQVKPSSSTLVKLSKTYLKEQKPRAAAAILRKAAVLAPRNPAIHYNLAVDLMKAGDLPAARQQLTQTLTLDHHDALAHLAMSDLARAEGNPVEADHELENAVESGVNTLDAHLRMGEIYLAHSDLRAEQEFRKALDDDPSSAAAHLRLGLLLLDRNPQDASLHLQTAMDLGLDSSDDRARVLSALGLLAYRQGDTDQTAVYLRQAAVLDPQPATLASIDYGIGILRREAGNPSGALAAFNSAAEEDPRSESYRIGPLVGQLSLYGSAQDALRDGLYATAADDFRSLLEEDPKNVEYRLGLGKTLLAHKDAAGARAEFIRVAEIDARNPEAWLHLSAADLQLGRDAESMQAISRALQLEPAWTVRRPDVDFLLGRVDLACGKPQDAETCFRYAASSHSSLVNFDECLVLLAEASQRADTVVSAMAPQRPAGAAGSPAARFLPAPAPQSYVMPLGGAAPESPAPPVRSP